MTIKIDIRLIPLVLLILSCTNDFKRGEDKLNVGDYEMARHFYSKVDTNSSDYNHAQIRLLEIDTILSKANYDKALVDYSMGKYADAQNSFNQVVESSYYYNQSKSYLDKIDSVFMVSRLNRERTRELVKVEDKKTLKTKLIEDERAVIQFREEVRELFNSLLAFKDNENFHRYGFAIGYEYNEWLVEVKRLKESPVDLQLIIKYDFGVGDLLQLGLEYMGTKGKETEYSLWAKKKIRAGLSK